MRCMPTATAPEVTSTYPVNGATDFPIGANLSVTFSEPVNVSTSWFTLTCSLSGTVTATSSGGPTTFTIDPDIVRREHERLGPMSFAERVVFIDFVALVLLWLFRGDIDLPQCAPHIADHE